MVPVFFILSACSEAPRFARADGQRSAKRKTPTQNRSFQEGTASYYAHAFHGKLTANGEKFNMNALTAAHKTLPFNTRLRVRNLRNNKTVIVRINDRGPYAKGRIIDLSLASAKKIGMLKSGTAPVRLEIIK